MTRRRVLRLLITAALMPIACSSPAVTAVPEPPTAEPPSSSIVVTAEEYGDEWPFTVPSGTLYCYEDLLEGRQYVTFGTGDGIEYGVNGSARDFGFPEMDETILTDYPDRSKTLPLIDRALELCE